MHERYEDTDGTIFPQHTLRWLYHWKRPADLHGFRGTGTNATVLELDDIIVGRKDVSDGPRRVFKGALYSGHANFDWLLAQIQLVQQVQNQIPQGQYLFELIHPQKDSLPALSTTGKYVVKLWILDAWRRVTVDDRVPVDLFGRPLCVASRPLQLWPILLCKAVLKVMSAFRILERIAPHEVSQPLQSLDCHIMQSRRLSLLFNIVTMISAAPAYSVD